MTNTIKILEDRIKHLEIEKQEIETRLSDARAELYKTENEIKRNKKPSPVMLAILSRLVEGAEIRSSAFNHRIWWGLNGQTETIPSNIFWGMHERQLIKETSREVMIYVYGITDWGREVWAKTNQQT